MSGRVFTIGHSTQTAEHFIELLQAHGISAIADVRSSPYSRTNPQFNRETLRETLRQCGIPYVFLGSELGARSKDPRCYRAGKVQYDLLARTTSFQEGIARVIEGSQKYPGPPGREPQGPGHPARRAGARPRGSYFFAGGRRGRARTGDGEGQRLIGLAGLHAFKVRRP